MVNNKAHSLDNFLALPPDPTPFNVWPLLPKTGMMLIFAPTKYLKSYLALNIAYQLANGDKVLDTWEVKNGPKRVLVIEQECGRDEAQSRARNLHRYKMGQWAGDNLWLVSKDLDCAVDSASGMALIDKHVTDSNAQIVVLDPWSWFHSRPENDNGEMKALVRKVLKWQQERKIATILTHHTSKPSEWRKGNGMDINSIKGGSALAEACSTIIGLSRPLPDDKDVLRLDFTCRHAADPFPLKLRFNGAAGELKLIP